ncbi:MAG TPA: hypothetical protein VG651_08625 [Stellaceae bacterium]|nr:hypothetical protein [Stellaceae bacterium]
MTHKLFLLALAASGVLLTSAGVYAAQRDLSPHAFRLAAAIVAPGGSLDSTGAQRDVIEPPSSIDPGMALDPPQTGRMRIVPPPAAAPSGRPILPR